MKRLNASQLNKAFNIIANLRGEDTEIHDQITNTLDELAAAFEDLRGKKVDCELRLSEHDMLGGEGGLHLRGSLRIQDCTYPAGIEFSANGPVFFWAAREISSLAGTNADVFKDGDKIELSEVSQDEVLGDELSGVCALQLAIMMQSKLIDTARHSKGGKQLIQRGQTGAGLPQTLQAPKLPINKPAQ